ncbi:MAG: ribose-phosphate pyrophosphokinase [bacterium]|nr:ribose-phosphate pyrophosphokinase [bacterium]
MFSSREDFALITGTSNTPLAEKIARYLGRSLTKTTIERFADGEIYAHIQENIRGVDVFIIQPTPASADALMEQLIMVDACRRASAQRITVVIPYMGYARQDRKDKPRVAITAKLVANLIVSSGADRVLAMDLHTPQLQGFFDIPVDHIYSAPVLLTHIKEQNLADIAVVAPDMGSVKMARSFAKRLNADLAIVDKRRPKPNVSEVMNLIGEVKGKNVVIFDDMIDTAGTIVNSAQLCLKLGALSVRAVATHGVLSGEAITRLDSSDIATVAITNTLDMAPKNLPEKFKILDVSPLLGEAIRRIHNSESVSSLFI